MDLYSCILAAWSFNGNMKLKMPLVLLVLFPSSIRSFVVIRSKMVSQDALLFLSGNHMNSNFTETLPSYSFTHHHLQEPIILGLQAN